MSVIETPPAHPFCNAYSPMPCLDGAHATGLCPRGCTHVLFPLAPATSAIDDALAIVPCLLRCLLLLCVCHIWFGQPFECSIDAHACAITINLTPISVSASCRCQCALLSPLLIASSQRTVCTCLSALVGRPCMLLLPAPKTGTNTITTTDNVLSVPQQRASFASHGRR